MEKTNSNYPRTRDTYTGRNIVYDESFSRTNKIILDSHSTTMMSEKTGEVEKKMAKKNIDGLRGPRGRGEGEWWRVEERRVRATLSSFSNSAPMKTGAKCFDIYRLPLLPGRFADGSEAGRRLEAARGKKKRNRRKRRLVVEAGGR